MKILKRVTTLLTAFVLMTSVILFVACSQESESGSGSETNTPDKFTVTFNLNYEGANNPEVQVTPGEKVEKPENPVRDGFDFDDWYTDAECSALYNFDSPVDADVTIYANWYEEGVTYHTVTFDLGYEGGVNFTKKVADGARLGTITEPERDGYSFFGWYTDEELTTAFKENTKFSADATLYARWCEIYVFEAEHTYLRDKVGPSSSGEGSYLDMLFDDSKNLGASNGYAVTYLYAKDGTINKYKTTLTFFIESDRAVSDAVLYLRMTAELASITINGDEYQVIVNGVVYNYEDISLDIVDRNTPGQFEDYLISKRVALVEGINTIELKVNNNESAIGGTTYAKAPVVDCIKISTDANIAWGRDEENNREYPIINEQFLM